MLVDRFKIGEILYEDIVGVTYRATDNESGKNLLVKILHENFAKQDELVQVFHQCCDIVCNLQSDNYLNALSHGYVKGKHYLVLENTDFTPLEILLKNSNVLPTMTGITLIENLAHTVDYAHSDNLIHGVISPFNTFVNIENNEVKIADFGFKDFFQILIAKREQSLVPALSYFSPEFIRGEKNLHPATDTYSLGALWYRILVGEAPLSEYRFDDYTKPEQVSAVIPPSLQRLEVPDFLDEFVLEALEPQSEKRYPNVTKFISSLAEAKSLFLATITPTSQIIQEHLGIEKEEEEVEEIQETEFSESVMESVVEPEETVIDFADQDVKDEPEMLTNEPEEAAEPSFEAELRSAIQDDDPEPSVVEESHDEVMNLDFSAKPDSIGDEIVNSDRALNQNRINLEDVSAKNISISPRLTDITLGRNGDDRPIASESVNDIDDIDDSYDRPFKHRMIWSMVKIGAAALIPIVLLYALIVFVMDSNFGQSVSDLKEYVPTTRSEAAKEMVKETPALVEKNPLENDFKDITEEMTSVPPSFENKREIASSTQISSSREIFTPVKSSPTENRRPMLTLAVGHRDATVYLDGQFYGKTNLRGSIAISNLSLKKPYLVKVEKDGFQLWARELILDKYTESLTVNLQRASTIPLNVTRTNTAPLNVTPAAATESRNGVVNVLLSNPEVINYAFVYINGKLWQGDQNIAPARINLPPGDYKIEIKKGGYKSEPTSLSLKLSGNDQRTVYFRLIPN